MARKLNLSYSESEWDIIEKKSGNAGIASYIQRKIKSLKDREGICDECLNELSSSVIVKPFHLSKENIEILDNLKEKTGKPISTIVCRLIIDPLLYK